MDTLQRTKDVLADAEKALAALASEAAKESDYEAASCLIEVAREVKSLSARVLQELRPELVESVVGEVGLARNGTARGSIAGLRPPTRSKRQKKSYPKFLRQGDELVKVGWSPTEKAEYEHKCGKKVVSVFAAAIAKAGANGRRFTMDRMMPLMDPADGAQIPDYQVYLCLAWFRELGFVIRHARKGYSLATKAPIEPLIETHWLNLPVR
jgi:hypothetical protein